VLIFPLLDKVLIGTSDIRVDDLEHIAITDEEVDYFFAMIGHVFPGIHLDRSQIVYTFSGVRPLQRTEQGATGQISRDHIVKVTEPGEALAFPVLSLVGGKWTSFRAFSEQATDLVLERLGEPRKVSTADLSIGGSKDYPKNPSEKDAYLRRLVEKYPVELNRLDQLFENYGTQVGELLEMAGASASTMLEFVPEISIGEIKYILTKEDVLHLDDLIIRRTMLAKLGKITPAGLQEIAQVCKDVFGWSVQETDGESDRFRNILRDKHRMNFNEFVVR
jgi:glycerol-3-phosphate dehydrogenase